MVTLTDIEIFFRGGVFLRGSLIAMSVAVFRFAWGCCGSVLCCGGKKGKQVRMVSDIESRVKGIVARQFGLSAEEVKNEASFMGDLGADSLGTVELVMALEEEFECEIPDEEAEKITTVQQSIDYICGRMSADS